MIRRILPFRLQLASQLLAMLVPWSAFVLAALGLVTLRSAEQFQRDRDQQITAALVAECAPLFHGGDLRGLEGVVEARQRAFPTLRYVFLQEPSGDLLWSSMDRGAPHALVGLRADRAPSGVRRVRLAGELVDDMVGRYSGLVLRAGFSVSPARELARRTLPVLAVVLLLGLGLVFALATWLSQPIERLAQAVGRAVELHGGEEAVAFTRRSETTTIAAGFEEIMDRLELRTKQLDSARKLAWLGEISSSIAHEVNNPLGTVVLNSSFLKTRLERGELPPASHREVERLWKAARRATQVVGKFLQFSRYSGSGGEALHRPAEPLRLAEEAVELLEDRVHGAGVAIRLELSDGLAPLLCDEQGILQVLINLLANAIDASPRGAEVTLRVTEEDDGVRFAVEDRGPGMDPAVAARAAEPFFTTKESGTGLGLAISDSIVRAHGGRLSFRAGEDGGTLVTLWLPAGRAE